MFTGQEDDKPKRLIGAREKREQAKKYASNFQVQSKREGQEPGMLFPVLIIFSLSVILAYFLSEGTLKAGIGFTSGDEVFDRIFLGAEYPVLMGDPAIDKVLSIFLRGALICGMAGFLPFVTYLWQHMIDHVRINLYYAFWGTTVGVALLYYLLRDMITPLLGSVIKLLF